MNTQANAMNGTPLESQRVVPAVQSATHPFYWSVRRELWENRAIYLTPLAAAGVFLIGFLISSAHLARHMRSALALDAMHQREKIAQPYDYAAGMVMLASLLVALYYCLVALQSERRDRSILFWKSLPVSDRTTILAKATVPLVIVPLLGWAITTVTQFVMLIVNCAALAGSSLSVATLWTELSPFQMSLLLLYHLITVHALWQAPIYGWLLMVSAWARRAAFLWATVPLLAIGIAEKMAFGTSYFGGMIGNRFAGGPEAIPMSDSFPTNPAMHLTPGHFLMSAGLWLGLAVTAAFLAAAVRLRRYREPI
jgi:ABC-2 type transport system permease protein